MRITAYFSPPTSQAVNGRYFLSPPRNADFSNLQQCTLVLPSGFSAGYEGPKRGRKGRTYILAPTGTKIIKLGPVGHLGAPVLEYYDDAPSDKKYAAFRRIACDALTPYAYQLVLAYCYGVPREGEERSYRWTLSTPTEGGQIPIRTAALYLPTSFFLCKADDPRDPATFLRPSPMLRIGTAAAEYLRLTPDFTGTDDNGNLYIDLTPVRAVYEDAHYKVPERITCLWREPGDLWDAPASIAWFSAQNYGVEVELGAGESTILKETVPPYHAWLTPSKPVQP